MNDADQVTNYVHQRLKWGVEGAHLGPAALPEGAGPEPESQSTEAGPESVGEAPIPAEPGLASEPPAASGGLVGPLLSCSEEEFQERAIESILRTKASATEVIAISEQRRNGVGRAQIVRDLLTAAPSSIEPPPDWRIALPRHIDVGGLLNSNLPRRQFITSAYELILRRMPSSGEVQAQSSALRWRTRSDFLIALSQSHEATSTGGEILFTGLGQRSPSLTRFLARLVPNYDSRPSPVSDWRAIAGPSENEKLAARTEDTLRVSTEALRCVLPALEDRMRELAAGLNRLRSRLEMEAERHDRIAGDVRAVRESLSGAAVSQEALACGLARIPPEVAEKIAAIQKDATQMWQTAVSSVVAEMRASLEASQVTAFGLARIPAEVAEQIAAVQKDTMQMWHTTVSSVVADMRASLEASQVTHLAALQKPLSRLRPPVIPGGDVAVVEVDGFLLGVPANEWRASSYYHYRGPMEPGVYALLQRMIRPGMVVADVGANVGLYTLLTARLLQGSGRVFSFEPTPSTFRVLRNNVQLNGFLEVGNVKMYELAIADKGGALYLYPHAEDSTHNSLFRDNSAAEPVEVRTASLDDLLGGESRLDFVKIDVEGAEPLVLEGMQNLCRNNPAISVVMEFAPVHLERAGRKPAEFLDQLTRYGFRTSIIDDLTGELQPAAPSVVLSRFSTNLLLMR